MAKEDVKFNDTVCVFRKSEGKINQKRRQKYSNYGICAVISGPLKPSRWVECSTECESEFRRERGKTEEIPEN